MLVTEIPKVILSTQVKDFGLYSSNRNHVRNPEEMFDINERKENSSERFSTLKSKNVGW